MISAGSQVQILSRPPKERRGDKPKEGIKGGRSEASKTTGFSFGVRKSVKLRKIQMSVGPKIRGPAGSLTSAYRVVNATSIDAESDSDRSPLKEAIRKESVIIRRKISQSRLRGMEEVD